MIALQMSSDFCFIANPIQTIINNNHYLKMNQEILGEVKEKLAEGHSHQEVFDQLKEKYQNAGKLLTSTLCKLPIPLRKKKLQFLWAILLALLSILVVLKALTILLSETIGLKIINMLHLIILIYIIYIFDR